MSSFERDPITAVQSYIAKNKGWKTEDYTIREDHRENDLVAYLVFYLPDKEIGHPAGGQSFLAYYDPTTGKIVREVRFQ